MQSICVGLMGFREVTTSEESQLEELRLKVRVGKLKNGKAIGKDEITGEMIKGGGDRVVDWIWRICNMAFENGVVPEDWRYAVIVPLYKDKGQRNECKNYRGSSLLRAVGKYTGILIESLERMRVLLMMSKGALEQGGGVCRSDLYTKADR